MDIKTLVKYVWREIHRGNLLIIASCIAAYFLVIVPIYTEVKDWLTGNSQAVGYVYQDIEELKAEIAELKKSTRRELTQRKAGKIGVTQH